MFSPRIQRYFRSRQTITALASLLLGMLISVVSNWLSEQWARYLPWLVGAAALAALAWLVVTLRHPAGIDVLIRAPRTARTEAEAARYARRGFVGFVPLFTQQGERLAPEECKKAMAALDFDRLNLENSNLAPTIKAILTHASRLEHVWLLSTTGKDAEGSLPAARLLAEYLRQRKGLTCQFHFGDDLSIVMDDDTEVLQKTYEVVRSVFTAAETSREINLPPREMIANITTGFRSMTLGMVLACLDREHDIEFVGTHYGPDGQPVRGDLLPITFSFEPLVE